MIVDDVLQRLADNGDINAQYLLGIRYCIRNKYPLAQYWLRHAAKQGHIVATELLSELKKRSFFNEY